MALVGIPTLGTHFIISNPKQMLLYMMKYYCVAPLSASNTFISQSISLGNRMSQYGYDKNAISDPIKQDLTGEMKRLFPNASSYTVDVVITEIDARKYAISISPSFTINDLTYYIDHTAYVANGVLMGPNDTLLNTTT